MTGHQRYPTYRRVPPIVLRADQPGLPTLSVVAAPELGGWVVVNAATLKVVEPGLLWGTREQAVAWARRELATQRMETMEYRRRQQLVARRGLAS